MSYLLHLSLIGLLAGCKDEAPRCPEGFTLSADLDCEAVSSAAEGIAASPRVYRLTHSQWEHTVQDLLGLESPSGLSDGFIGDGLSAGYENNAEYLEVGSETWQDYQTAAETLAQRVVTQPALYATVVPEDPRPDGVDFSWLLEAEDGEVVATYGEPFDEGWRLVIEGSVTELPLMVVYGEVEVIEEGTYVASARMWAELCDGEEADVHLSVDDQLLVETTIGEAPQTLSGQTYLEAGTHTVAVKYRYRCQAHELADEDAIPMQAISLFVDHLALDGASSTLGPGHAARADIKRWIKRFGALAHRRPLTDEMVADYLDLFDEAADRVERGDEVAEGVRTVLAALLQSPYFLYRLELGTEVDAEGHAQLDDWDLASKLSYALWNTMPDECLRASAAHGHLVDPEGLQDEAERMLMDPQAAESIADFHRQWLGLDPWVNMVKDSDRFPWWNEQIPGAMRDEALALVHAVAVEQDQGLRALLTADYTYIDATLAAVYGVPDLGADVVRVELDPGQRSGLLTLSGLLAYGADSRQPSSIQRGVFISRSLLCATLESQPDGVGELPRIGSGQTNRERVEATTGVGTCGESCHATQINPPGFALEHYDAAGGFRSTDHGQSIDASGSYDFGVDGVQSWDDGVDFAGLLASSSQVHRCYAEQWLEYALARESHPDDAVLLDRLAADSLESDASVRDLMLQIVRSDAFRLHPPSEDD